MYLWWALGLLLVRDPELIEVHDPSGQQSIYLNANEIVSLRSPFAANQKFLARGTKCVIVMGNGNSIAVFEDCYTVLKKIR